MSLLAVIGYPIAHSLSPAIHNAAFPAMGLDALLEKWTTPPSDLSKTIERLRAADMLGICVTVPHKQAVMPFLDAVDPAARAIGAVSCIVKGADGKLTGHNTDKYGFLRSLREAGCDPGGKRAVVLGSGGAAHAVGYGLAEAGATEVAFAGRTPDHVATIAAHLRATTPRPLTVRELGWRDEVLVAACQDADLVVNCTPVGMRHTDSEGTSPLAIECLRPGLWVCDTVYTPAETELLRLAKKAGARPIPGLEMLIYQAAECLRLWTGREAPIDIMRLAAHKALDGTEGREP